MRVPPLAVPALLLTITLLSGCSADDAKQNSADLVPVSGTVTLDGQPLAGAAVTFAPTGETKGMASYGGTDPDGKFVLKDRHGREGAPVGKFQVIISKIAMPDGSPISEGSDPITSGAVEKIPPQYSDPEKTQLTAEVPAGGKTFEFKLVSKKK